MLRLKRDLLLLLVFSAVVAICGLIWGKPFVISQADHSGDSIQSISVSKAPGDFRASVARSRGNS